MIKFPYQGYNSPLEYNPIGESALSNAATMDRENFVLYKIVSSVDRRRKKSSGMIKPSSIMHVELAQLGATNR